MMLDLPDPKPLRPHCVQYFKYYLMKDRKCHAKPPKELDDAEMRGVVFRNRSHTRLSFVRAFVNEAVQSVAWFMPWHPPKRSAAILWNISLRRFRLDIIFLAYIRIDKNVVDQDAEGFNPERLRKGEGSAREMEKYLTTFGLEAGLVSARIFRWW